MLSPVTNPLRLAEVTAEEDGEGNEGEKSWNGFRSSDTSCTLPRPGNCVVRDNSAELLGLSSPSENKFGEGSTENWNGR